MSIIYVFCVDNKSINVRRVPLWDYIKINILAELCVAPFPSPLPCPAFHQGGQEIALMCLPACLPYGDSWKCQWIFKYSLPCYFVSWQLFGSLTYKFTQFIIFPVLLSAFFLSFRPSTIELKCPLLSMSVDFKQLIKSMRLEKIEKNQREILVFWHDLRLCRWVNVSVIKLYFSESLKRYKMISFDHHFYHNYF